MSFIATANPPAATAEPPIENDGWWPDIDRVELRRAVRLDGTVTVERLQLAVLEAMAAVNAELQTWRDAMQDEGHDTLADVPATKLAGESVKLRRYRRAIYCHVQAQLAEAYRDTDTLPQGAGKEPRVMSALELRVDTFLQQLRWAIADVQGASRVIAELL